MYGITWPAQSSSHERDLQHMLQKKHSSFLHRTLLSFKCQVLATIWCILSEFKEGVTTETCSDLNWKKKEHTSLLCPLASLIAPSFLLVQLSFSLLMHPQLWSSQEQNLHILIWNASKKIMEKQMEKTSFPKIKDGENLKKSRIFQSLWITRYLIESHIPSLWTQLRLKQERNIRHLSTFPV